MNKSLTWTNFESHGFGDCMFFNADIPQTKIHAQLSRYGIDVFPILSEYTLFIIHDYDNYIEIGRYSSFELASKAANHHYQTNITHVHPDCVH